MVTAVQFLPALIEVLRLFLYAVVAVAAVLAFIKINYILSRVVWYVPAMAIFGILLAYVLQTDFNADKSLTACAALFPIFIAAFFRFALKGRYQTAMYFAAPAVFGVALLFIYPLAFEFYLAFHRLNLGTLAQWIKTGHIDFVGFDNFKLVLNVGSETHDSFWLLLGRTILWTGVNLFFHLVGGVCLALILNQKIRGVGIYRTILILPWAIPQLIAVLAWRGEFHITYGYVNQMLGLIGIAPRQWWSNPHDLFMSMCIVNIWLGIPFMMVIALSGLQSISKSYYEAAAIDGATKWQQFRNITVPLLKPTLIPATILGTIWTFNNVNVVYLMSGQRGGSEGADILVSDLYKQAFVFNRYSFSAAYAVVIFFILTFMTMFWLRTSKVDA